MEQLYLILLFMVSVSEIAIGYWLLFHTILNKDSLNSFSKIVIMISIVLLGSMLSMNRRVAFFSSYVFLTIVVLFCLVVCFIRKKDIVFTCSLICLYCETIALIDFLMVFLSMPLFGENLLEIIYMHSSSLWQIFLYVVSRVCTFVVVVWIIKSEGRITEEYTRIFVLIDVILLGVLLRYQKIVVGMVFGVTNMDGINGGGSLLAILLVISIVMVLVLKNQVMQKEKNFLELHDRMTEQSYQTLLHNVEVNRALVHDVKHRLLLLRKLVDEGNVDKIKLYMDEIEEEYKELPDREWTGNRFLDFIINQKKQRAEEMGIQAAIESEIIPKWILTENEMSIIFGNLLDNAIEACEKIRNRDKWFVLSLKKKGNIILIKIVNSIGEQPDTFHGKLISDKRDSHLHGNGLKSVQRIVERHDGTMDWYIREHEFHMNIIFFDND